METIAWDQASMSAGVSSIDGQHKELIKMLNAFAQATAAGKGKEELGKMIGFLGNYTKLHFAHEEKVMAEHNCPMAKHNKEAHAKFLQDFTALTEKFEKDGPSQMFVLDVQRKVMGWLMNHIKGCDSRLRDCPSVKAA